MLVNEIVLVAGLNYTEYRVKSKSFVLDPANAGPWRNYAVRWAQKKFIADNTLRITLFDFFKGTRENITFSKGKPVFTVEMSGKQLDFSHYRRVDTTTNMLVPPEKSLPFNAPDIHILYFTGISEIGPGPVSIDDYKKQFFDKASSPPSEVSISITDVYQYLVDTGTSRAGTVKELHIFSHAYAGGPILVNSKDIKNGAFKRDPLDKDTRANKDFNTLNVTLDSFSKAFASDATSIVWGCIAWTFMKLLIKYTMDQKTKIPKPDDKKFQFTWTTDWVETLDSFHSILGGDIRGNKSDKKSLDEIKTVIAAAISSTYMQKLAGASKNRVLGALPGTYTDLDDTGSVNERFLHVPMGARSNNKAGENFLGALSFYNKVMGVSFEPSLFGGWPPFGRGFGIYK